MLDAKTSKNSSPGEKLETYSPNHCISHKPLEFKG